MPRPDLTDDQCSDREEAAYEARMERQASRSWCAECRLGGGIHKPGCPEDNEQESSDE